MSVDDHHHHCRLIEDRHTAPCMSSGNLCGSQRWQRDFSVVTNLIHPGTSRSTWATTPALIRSSVKFMSIASRKARFAGTTTSNRAMWPKWTGVADSTNHRQSTALLARVLTCLSHDRTTECSAADVDISCETTPAFPDLQRSSSTSLRCKLRLTWLAPDKDGPLYVDLGFNTSRAVAGIRWRRRKVQCVSSCNHEVLVDCPGK